MGTLRAWKRKNQISRAQFRANSGVSAAMESVVEREEIEFAGWAGSVQIRALNVSNESWFWLPVCAGTAGLDCESGDEFALQHDIAPPHWQQARTCLAHGDGICCAARRNGVPASTRLQMMAHIVFTLLISCTRLKSPAICWF